MQREKLQPQIFYYALSWKKQDMYGYEFQKQMCAETYAQFKAITYVNLTVIHVAGD